MNDWQEYVDRVLTENDEVRREYERLGPLYAIIGDVLSLRYDLGLSQAQLAARMGKQQPAIARFESGNAENPTLGFIQQLAEALDADLTIRLEPKAKAQTQKARKGVRQVADERATYSPS